MTGRDARAAGYIRKACLSAKPVDLAKEPSTVDLLKIPALLRKARSKPRQAIQRSRKAIAGTTASLLPSALQRERPGNVVMLHVGRSGSTVLGDMLDQHPRIYWDGEVYHRALQEPSRANEPFHLLMSRMRRAGRAYYGFEMKPVHLRALRLELTDFIDSLDRLGFTHFIVLERRNYLRKILSSEIAHKSTVFHRAPSDPLTRSRATLDLKRVEIDNTVLPLLDFLATYEEFFLSLRNSLKGETTLWLTYEEDILESPVIAYRKTLSFLGIETADTPRIWYAKTNPFPIQDMLANFDEVQGVLRGTRFEWMLHE